MRRLQNLPWGHGTVDVATTSLRKNTELLRDAAEIYFNEVMYLVFPAVLLLWSFADSQSQEQRYESHHYSFKHCYGNWCSHHLLRSDMVQTRNNSDVMLMTVVVLAVRQRCSHKRVLKFTIPKINGSPRVIHQLLMQAGDVETNPGPENLTIRDLNTVLTSIFDAKTKWDFIGLALGMQSSELEAIEQENDSTDQRFKEMLKKWLKTLNPSWESLVQALRNKTVEELQLANAIARDHCEATAPKELKSVSEASISSGKKWEETGDHVVKSEDVQFLMDLLYQQAFKWKAIGGALRFSHVELCNIESNSEADAVQLLRGLLNQWCEWPTAAHSERPTLKSLYDALRSDPVGLGAAATELYDKKTLLPSWPSTVQSPSSAQDQPPRLPLSPPPPPPPPVEKEQFPYLDTRNLTKQGRDDLVVRLKVESKDIQRKFGSLLCKAEKALEAAEVVVDNLISFLENSDCDTVAECIEYSDTIPVVMRKIKRSKCWSFFDHELLHSLIQTYCKSGDIILKEYKAYVSDFEDYCKRRIYEVPANVFSSEASADSNSSERNVVVKIDEKFCVPLTLIKEVEYKLSKIFGVSLKLVSLEDGCIEITFKFFCTKELKRLNETVKTDLVALKIVWLRHGKYKYNDLPAYSKDFDYEKQQPPFKQQPPLLPLPSFQPWHDAPRYHPAQQFQFSPQVLTPKVEHMGLPINQVDGPRPQMNAAYPNIQQQASVASPQWPTPYQLGQQPTSAMQPSAAFLYSPHTVFHQNQFPAFQQAPSINQVDGPRPQMNAAYLYAPNIQQQAGVASPQWPTPYQLGHPLVPQPTSAMQPSAAFLYSPHTVFHQNQFPAFQQAPLYSQHGLEHSQQCISKDEVFYPEKFKDRIELVLESQDIKEDLTSDNYKKKFYNLVCYEEMSNIEILGRKCDNKCDLTLFQRGDPPVWIRSKYMYKQAMRYGYLENVTADQIAYATQASEAVFVVSRNKSIELRMEILKENYRHSDEKLYVAFREDESNKLSRIISSHDSLPPGEIHIHGLLVEFEVKHDFFDSLIRAINCMHQGIIARLLPTLKSFIAIKLVPEFDLKFLLSNIPNGIAIDNESQFKALHRIVSCVRSSPPLIVSGSFGTGKTRILAVATHCLIQNGMRFEAPVKILVCAHHYHSVDHFVHQYFGKMFGSNKQVALFRLISETYFVGESQYSKLYVTAASMKDCNFDVYRYVIIVTEFLTAQPLLEIFGVGFFTHILIDEGSQIVEPQAIAALSLAGSATKIVIVGDSCQVGPSLSVLGEEARECGLKYSLQERLQTLYSKLGGHASEHLVSVTTNYRCHESIMQISNHLFYEDKIKSSPLNALPHHLAEFPLLFVCSSLTKEVDRDYEAQLLMDNMDHFVLSNWPTNRWGELDWSKICLTTATQTQLVITRTLSKKRYQALSQCINILTAYRVQGNEYQALFWSTIEPLDSEGNTVNPTKSPCDPYVFNTVLTRSKSLVVVVGSPLALLGIEEHMVRRYGRRGQCWSSYINLCLKNNTFIIPLKIEASDEGRNNFLSALNSKLLKLSKTVFDTSMHEISVRPKTKEKVKSPTKDLSSSIVHHLSHVATTSRISEAISTPYTIGASSSSPHVKRSDTSTPLTSESKDRLLKEELTANNYKDKFRLLLNAEKEEHRVQLSKKCDGVYTIQIFRFVPNNLSYDDDAKYVKFGCITSANGDAILYAKQASESSVITINRIGCIVHATHVQATVPKGVFSSAIMIGFEQKEFQKLKAININDKFDANVKFNIQESYFKMLHKALSSVPHEIVLKLNPTNETFCAIKSEEYCTISKPPYEGIQLDKFQMNALYLILKSSHILPVLIAGSFGTGKTRLLVRATYEILKKRRSRVLICAHHQSSVDTFVHYFSEMKSHEARYFWAVNVIRVFPNDSYISGIKQKFNIHYKSKFKLSEDDLENCQLIITTFSTASTLLGKVKPEQRVGFFSHVLIDEGAQVREPEMVGALTLAGPETKIVIAGDHFQVGPNILVLGEIARRHGLGQSPLERLHNIYDRAKNLLSKSCSATLLTNYRCHSSILMLPSSLYYQSSLLSRADSTTHQLAPFPLTFVCTDIEREFQNRAGANEQEADALIRQVNKYLKDWPEQWKSRTRKICIMTSSPTQLSVLRKKARDLNECEVLPAYNIQGNEFEAIFISTSEATTEACEPFHITKSMCDRFVFNTALTRARSLVVALGNPFFLLKMEENMIKKYNDSSYRTWKSYIRQCLECNSFSYSDSIEKSSINITTQQLYEQVYSGSIQPNYQTQDSILQNYQRVFKGMKGCKNTKLILSSNEDAELSWKVKSDDADNAHSEKLQEEKISYSDQYICQLKFLNYRTVEAVPVSDMSKRDVLIQGKKNILNAFDGDTAMVGIFDDCPPNKQYGRVIEVLKRGSNLRFVCRVADYSPIIFFPIDKKNPKLANLPMLSRVLLQKKAEELDSTSKEQNTKLQYNDVIVFDPRFDNDGLPQVVQVIPHSVAQKMLFIVSFLMWKKKYANPLGIVIGMCSLGHTFLKAELLLKMKHSVVYNSETDCQDCIVHDVAIQSDLPTCNRAFTIDPSNALDLDDALSVTSLGVNSNGFEVYELGVHIANVAKYITCGSDEDKDAKALGISVYSDKEGEKMMHMIQNHTIRQALSLLPGRLRDVLSVTCTITLLPHNVKIENVNICPAQMRSAFKLSYEQAQELLKSKIPKKLTFAVSRYDADDKNPSLCSSMKLLYDVAMVLRQRRLCSNSALVYEVDEHEEGKNWQSHLLVSEFMIWANNEVAKKIHSDHPNAAILCMQEAPLKEKLKDLIEQNINTISCSFQLSRYLLESCTEGLPITDTKISIPYDLLERVLDESDHVFLAHLLSSDRLYPQLAAVASKFLTISKHSEYCCTQEGEADPSAYRHYSLCLDKYTSFTSPIRRYVDIVVQRILLQQSNLSNEELEELCIAFGKFKRNASGFEKAIGKVRLASNLLSHSKISTAYVAQHHPTSVELTFYDPDLQLKYLPLTAKTLNTNRCFPYAKDSQVYTWKLRVTSLNENFAAELLQIPDFSVERCAPNTNYNSNVHFLKAFCSSDDTRLDIQEFVAIPHAPGVPVDPQEIKKFTNKPSKKSAVQVKEILKSLPRKPVPTSPELDTSNTSFLFLDCDVKLPLREADPVKLWLSMSTKEPVINPAIQLLEVSPLLRICLQHNTHPADCFSDPDFQKASQEVYSSLEEYIDLWKKVLLAEAAVNSVHQCQPIVIQGVYLEWPTLETLDNCTEVQFCAPNDFIKMVLPSNFEQCSEFFRLSVGDMLCARYGSNYSHSDENLRAVYHFVVYKVFTPQKKENKKKWKKEQKLKQKFS